MIINTAQGGGKLKTDLNIFCQSQLPASKFDGLALLTSDTYDDIVTKYQFNISGKWRGDTTDSLPDGVTSRDGTSSFIIRYNGYIYVVDKSESQFILYRIDEATGVRTAVLTKSIYNDSNTTVSLGGHIVRSGDIIYTVVCSNRDSSYIYYIAYSYNTVTGVVHTSSAYKIYRPTDVYTPLQGDVPLLFVHPDSNMVYAYVLGIFKASNKEIKTCILYLVDDGSTLVLNAMTSFDEIFATSDMGFFWCAEEVIYNPALNHFYILSHYNKSGVYSIIVMDFDVTNSMLTKLQITTTSSSSYYNYGVSSSLFLYSQKFFIVDFAKDNSHLFIYDLFSGSVTMSAECPGSLDTVKGVQFDSIIRFFGKGAETPNYIYDMFNNIWTQETRGATEHQAINSVHYEKLDDTVIFTQSGGSKLSGYVYESEELPENTLAILLEDNTNLVKFYINKNIFFRTGIRNAWIYKHGKYQEYPTYLGDGISWTKFKN